MMKIPKNVVLPLLAIAASFYLLPLLIRDTGSGMLVLLVVLPLICFVCSLLLGRKHGFCWWFALAVALLFCPAIFLFYNASAWVYAPLYGAISLLGMIVGANKPK